MKFTSEDLLKAMGLKVGDKVDTTHGAYTVINNKIFQDINLVDKNGMSHPLSSLFGCDYKIIQPKPILTEDEKVILRNLPVDCGYWITRDSDNILIGSEKEPKEYKKGKWNYTNQWFSIIPFEHLFKFIKVGEKYSIEELLKE